MATAQFSPTQQLGIIGLGVMGQALCQAFFKQGLIDEKSVWGTTRTQASCDKLSQQLGFSVTKQYDAFLPHTRVVLVCVKPARVTEVLQQLHQRGLRSDALVISIVAGKRISQLQEALPAGNPVIRAMPNTPCLVGQGMTALSVSEHVAATDLDLAKALFASVGQTLELDEKYFDAVTGLSGSGPAYMYLMMEALADGGVRVGLPRDVAMALVVQMALGAATMIRTTGKHPAALRDDVTTPAGCTIAGLLTLEDGKIRSVLARAVEEATKTAAGLS